VYEVVPAVDLGVPGRQQPTPRPAGTTSKDSSVVAASAAIRGGDVRRSAASQKSRIGPDLAVLLDLVQRGQFDPQIGWRGSWLPAADAAQALLARQVPGKAVLEIG
jgi:hypothetical protein